MNNKSFIKSIIFSFVLSGVLFFSVLLPCFPVYAEGSGTLPYIVPQNTDLNTFYSSSSLEAAIYFYETYIVNSTSVNSYFVYTDYGIINDSYYSFVFVTNPTITSIVTPNYDYYSNYISVRSNDVQVVRLMVNISTNSIDASNALGYNVNLLGSVTKTKE